MRRRSRLTNLQAGLLTLVLILAGTYMGFTRTLPGTHHWQLHALVSSSEELAKGAPVRIAGVNVGKVRSVRPGPGGTARVTMEIERAGRPIHADATLKIRPRLLLEGNFFVDLRPGSPSAPVLADGSTLRPAQASAAVRLDQVLDVLERDPRLQLQTTLRELARALDQGGAQGLNAGLAAAPGAFAGTAILTRAAQGTQPHDVRRLIAAGSRLGPAIAARDADLQRLLTSYNVTLGTLAAHRSDLEATLQEAALTLSTARRGLDALRAAAPALTDFAQRLRPALRRAPRPLRLAAPFLTALGAATAPDRIPALTDALRAPLEDARVLEPRLRRLFGLVEPVASCVSSHVLPVLFSELDDGKLSTGLPVWRELLSFPVGLVSASANHTGNGGDLRFVLGPGSDTVSVGSGRGPSELFGSAVAPILGSRPATPQHVPPFEPTAPCAAQRLADLRAAALAQPPVGGRARPRTLTAADRRLLRRLRDPAAAAGLLSRPEALLGPLRARP
jgi:virulence factor Mce-like protein